MKPRTVASVLTLLLATVCQFFGPALRKAMAAPLFDAPFLSIQTGSQPYDVAIGYLDGNSWPDLVVANSLSNTVSVLLGNGDGTFRPKSDFTTGKNPTFVQVEDLNGDGFTDLVVANSTIPDFSGSVSVLLGNGSGQFGPKHDFVTGIWPLSLAIGDVNRDGRQDLVVANYLAVHEDYTVSVLLGNGDGSFGPKRDFDTGKTPSSISMGDLNQDGTLDLVIATERAIAVLLGNGDGTFGPSTEFGTGGPTGRVAIGDLNHDDWLDVAVAVPIYASSAVAVFLGNGDGTLRAPTSFPTGENPVGIAIGDLNGDGWPDLAAANAGYASYPQTVSVLLGKGDGAFEADGEYFTGSNPGAVVIRDLNGDRCPDVVVTKHFTDTVSVLLGNGDGTLGTKTVFETGECPYSLAIGDLNQDRRPDVVIANSYDSWYSPATVSVLLGGGGDGIFGAKTDFATGSAPLSVAIKDINDDGRPDVTAATTNDLSVLLGRGDGTLESNTNFGAGTYPNSVAISDLNEDGRNDVAVANDSSATVSVLLGDGRGAFGMKTDFDTGANPRSVTIQDLDGDGHQDLVTADYGANMVSVLLGDGRGAFSPRADYGTGRYPISVAAGDLNQDGHLDLVVANDSSNTVSVLLGDRDGRLQPRVDFSTGLNPHSVALGDLDGDGMLDLATANYGSNTVSILLGIGDGTFQPKGDFGTARSPNAVAIEDLNGDGRSDLAIVDFAENNVLVMLNHTEITPVLVEDLEVAAFGGLVRLRWRLSAAARSELRCIAVQRATAAEGPYIACSSSPVRPSAEMVFEDTGLEIGIYWYRLVLIGREGSEALAGPVCIQVGVREPRITALEQPFEPADGGPVQIRYSLADTRTVVRFTIYDVRGRVVWSSEGIVQAPGQHIQTWDRRTRSNARAPRGIYLVCLDANEVKITKKILLLR